MTLALLPAIKWLALQLDLDWVHLLVAIVAMALAGVLAAIAMRMPPPQPHHPAPAPPPMPPPAPRHSGPGQAPVYRSPLRICYRDADGKLREATIHPKTIGGDSVASGAVRPEAVNAFCEETQTMQTFRFADIMWAADARTGDFVEDLYTYLGNAQPGGAPAPLYERPASPARLRHWKRPF
jgi:hypothetical protein